MGVTYGDETIFIYSKSTRALGIKRVSGDFHKHTTTQNYIITKRMSALITTVLVQQ